MTARKIIEKEVWPGLCKPPQLQIHLAGMCTLWAPSSYTNNTVYFVFLFSMSNQNYIISDHGKQFICTSYTVLLLVLVISVLLEKSFSFSWCTVCACDSTMVATRVTTTTGDTLVILPHLHTCRTWHLDTVDSIPVTGMSLLVKFHSDEFVFMSSVLLGGTVFGQQEITL